MKYDDFELKVRSKGGQEYEVEVRSPAGEKTSTVRFPYDHIALQARLQALENALRSAGTGRDIRIEGQDTSHQLAKNTVEDFGRKLFDTLIGGEMLGLYSSSRRMAEAKGCGLRLQLRMEAELASVPWEYMYDPSEGDFVCL